MRSVDVSSPAGSSQGPIPVVMDVDTGIDDALALLVAVRSAEIDLVGVGTVSGNVSASVAARNTLRVLEVAGADSVPVAVGADRPLMEPPHEATWVHGRDGLGDSGQPQPQGAPSDEHAVDQLLRLSVEHAGELVVVAVGPLTNVAIALARDPSLAGRLARIVLMGGSARSGGNRSAWAEANIACDPEAAEIVFGCSVPRTMVGLDVTMQVRLDEADAQALAEQHDDVARFAAQILPFYLDAYASWTGERRCAVHDPLAVAVVAHPGLVTTYPLPTRVELHGSQTRGMTVVDLRALMRVDPAVDVVTTDVALEVDVQAARDFVLGRLSGAAD